MIFMGPSFWMSFGWNSVRDTNTNFAHTMKTGQILLILLVLLACGQANILAESVYERDTSTRQTASIIPGTDLGNDWQWTWLGFLWCGAEPWVYRYESNDWLYLLLAQESDAYYAYSMKTSGWFYFSLVFWPWAYSFGDSSYAIYGAEEPEPFTYQGITSYYPAWHDVEPLRTLEFTADPNKTAVDNGLALAGYLENLKPGDRFVVGEGTYSIDRYFSLNISGTAEAPIWIVAKEGTRPVITRPNDNQNVVNFGQQQPVRYLCFRGFEITGGSYALRLHDCQQVWIDDCLIHDCNGVGIGVNSHDTNAIHITRNEIYNPSTTNTGEGMYLGANNSAVRMTDSVIALNHVYDCGGTQGDGIELKQGSYNNWIAENHVHDTNYPGILVYGTDGLGINVIERNTVYNSNDNTMQIKGEAIVRNNLVMNGAGSAFVSQPHQGDPVNLTVVHNTFIDDERAASLRGWNSEGFIFANNAVYSGDRAILWDGTNAATTFSGNVLFGSTSYLSDTPAMALAMGAGLADFLSISWDAVNRDASPSANSPLISAADSQYAEELDITGSNRQGELDAGAFDFKD